jgi:hypothetical protein
MASTTKTELLARVQQTVAGIMQYFPNAQTLMLKGTATPTQNVLQLLQSYAKAYAAAQTAKATATDAVATEEALALQIHPMLSAIKSMVVTQLGESAAVLKAFSIPTTTPQKPTTATKAAAAAQMVLTKKLRGVEGKRKRAKISAKTVAPAAPPPAPKV